MLDGFVPLDRWLQPQLDEPIAVRVEPELEKEEPSRDETDDAIADARRFRAALADALDCIVDDVLATIASAVLGRELLLSPPDVRKIVTDAVDETDMCGILRVRVHPGDWRACEDLPYDVCADDTLRPGDAVLDLSHGTIDASLGARLARILAR